MTEGRAQHAVESLTGKARERASDEFDAQKARAAGQLDEVADAVRAGSERMNRGQSDGIARYLEQAANRIDLWSDWMRTAEPRDLKHDLERLARSHPAVFIGSALALGIAGARFLRSSEGGARDASFSAEPGATLAPAESWSDAGEWREADELFGFVRTHPLLVAAGAAAIGAAIGAALPETAREQHWMGPARDRAVERARTGARRAVEKARVEGGRLAADAVNRAVSGKPS